MTHLPPGPVHGCLPPLCHVIMSNGHAVAAAAQSLPLGVVVVLGVLVWFPWYVSGCAVRAQRNREVRKTRRGPR